MVGDFGIKSLVVGKEPDSAIGSILVVVGNLRTFGNNDQVFFSLGQTVLSKRCSTTRVDWWLFSWQFSLRPCDALNNCLVFFMAGEQEGVLASFAGDNFS